MKRDLSLPYLSSSKSLLRISPPLGNLYQIRIVIYVISPLKDSSSFLPSSSLDRIEETISSAGEEREETPQHLENGRGIFRSVSGNVCKVTSGNSRAGATRSEPLRGSVRARWAEGAGGGRDARARALESSGARHSTKSSLKLWHERNAPRTKRG